MYLSLETFARYSEIAAELGAKYIILHGGRPDLNMTDEEYCERYMNLKNITRKNGVWFYAYGDGENVYVEAGKKNKKPVLDGRFMSMVISPVKAK